LPYEKKDKSNANCKTNIGIFICTKNNLSCGSMILGEVIRSTRIKKNLTQQQVCASAHIAQGYYSAIENGVVPTIDILTRISKTFNLPLLFLIWMATEKSDMPKHLKAWYSALEPVFKAIIEEQFNNE